MAASAITRVAPIKLDLGLISDIDRDPARRALASSLVAFGTDVGSAVVAEGIETGDELETLRSLGVPYGQGYYLGRRASLPLHDTSAPPVSV